MESKIRVLCVAPYEGMKSAIESLSAYYPQMELTLLVGDLENGLEVARDNFHGNFDVVISRGGTARMLQEHLSLPVIEIEMSLYDVLCALKLAGDVAGRIAVVSLADFGPGVRSIGDLLGYDVDFIISDSRDEVEKALREVQKRDYSVLLCDMVANTTAKMLGMNPYLIVSGIESIRLAFDRAVSLCRSLERLKNENSFFREIINGQISDTVVFAEDDSVFLSTAQDGASSLITVLRQEIQETRREGQRRFSRILDGMIFSVRARVISVGERSYAAFFYTRRKTSLPASQTGITYFTRVEAEKEFFDSILSISGLIQNYQSQIAKVCGSRSPVIIVGEEGCEIETIAYVIYLRSALKNNSLVRIDCRLLNEKSWNFLSENSGSPMADEGNTIYFTNITALSHEYQHKLLALLTDMDVCRRNRVILSCLYQPDTSSLSAETLFADTLRCLTFPVAPLREHADQIPGLVNLALSHINADLPTHILGVEPAAMEMLQCFSWPHNFLQFRRVIGELAATSPTTVISAQQVSQMLRTERHIGSFRPTAEGASAPLDLNRSLAEIERDIAIRTVAENGGNQTAAAKHLGISRTTLWRLLKE